MHLQLNSIKIVGKNRVEFDYSCDREVRKYFSKENFYAEYSIDITNVPASILVIPFLGNILPISWFAGFSVDVTDTDRDFYEAITLLKNAFERYYPQIRDKKSSFTTLRVSENCNTTQDRTAMLFSGGVDAFTTFFRHFDETPDLITIKGADIDVNDQEQWKGVVEFNKRTSALQRNKQFYIESNMRSFISFEVERLLYGLGWWGKIQHGLALTCLTAPIAYINKYKTVYIASTRSSKMPFTPWGSMPEIDNIVKFCNTRIDHDGYELTRFDKVRTIIELSKKHNEHPPLRVCYHNHKDKLNCNVCEKCCRTIFAIMVINKDPNLYGFSADFRIYAQIEAHLKNGFSTEGVKFYWDELVNNITLNDFYFFKNIEDETAELKKIIIANNVAQTKGVISKGGSGRYIYKQKLISTYPKLFNLYLNLRRKL